MCAAEDFKDEVNQICWACLSHMINMCALCMESHDLHVHGAPIILNILHLTLTVDSIHDLITIWGEMIHCVRTLFACHPFFPLCV